MLRHRLTFGPVLLLALCAIFWLDQTLAMRRIPEWLSPLFQGRERFPAGIGLFAMLAGLTPLASYELAKILRANGVACSVALTCVAGLLGLLASWVVPIGSPNAGPIVATAAITVLVLSMIFYSRHQTAEGVVAATGGALMAFVYLGLMAGFLLAIRRGHDAWVVLAVIGVTKSCDIGAFFTGTAIGRHKLAPWLSPGKTWEGLAGGVATSAIVGAVLASFAGHLPNPTLEPSAPMGALVGALLGVAGQAGDLLASLLKRDAGLKDASRALPGFGGLLDVIDSPLLAAPIAFWLLRVMHV